MKFHGVGLRFWVVAIFLVTFICIANATPDHPRKPQTPIIVLPPSHDQQCPAPTPELLRCLKQWACQHLIRLDLRCLLNLNGTPLLGGLLGGDSGGGGGGLLGGVLGGGGGGGGVLGGLLG